MALQLVYIVVETSESSSKSEYLIVNWFSLWLCLFIQDAIAVLVVWGQAQCISKYFHSCCVHIGQRKRERKKWLKLNNSFGIFRPTLAILRCIFCHLNQINAVPLSSPPPAPPRPPGTSPKRLSSLPGLISY